MSSVDDSSLQHPQQFLIGHEEDSGGVHACHNCGWPFPNSNPSDRHKQAHKKVCVTIEGYTPGNDALHKTHSDGEHDERKTRSGKVFARPVSMSSSGVDNRSRRSTSFKDKVLADAVTADGLCVGESSDAGLEEDSGGERAHKKVCGTNEGYTPGNDALHKTRSDGQHDERKTRSGKVLTRPISMSSSGVDSRSRRSARFKDRVLADAVTADVLFVGRSSDSGHEEDSGGERAHKKVCGTSEGYTPGIDALHKTHSDGQHDERKTRSGKVLTRPISMSSSGADSRSRRSARFKDRVLADAVTADVLCAGRSSDSGESKKSELKTSEDISVLRAMVVESTDSGTEDTEKPVEDISVNNTGCSREVDVPRNSGFLDPAQALTTFPGSRLEPEKFIITDDLTLLLIPRIKLDFIFGCTEGTVWRILSESYLKYYFTNSFNNSYIFRTPVIIPEDDVHVRYVSQPKWTEGEDNMFIVAEGCFFVRDPKLVNKELLVKDRDFLLQKLGTWRIICPDANYKFRLSLPPSEDADIMMTQIDNSGPSHQPPTIMIKGLPFQWFAEQPDSPKPSKRLLLIFLKNFGNVRTFDVVEDGVSVQYEDCYKALQSLCSCSLQKAGSGETADYTVMWKDHEVDASNFASKEDSMSNRICRFRRVVRHGGLIPLPPSP